MSERNPILDIVIPSYNRYDYLTKLLKSIFVNLEFAFSGDIDLTVIDNCSIDPRYSNLLKPFGPTSFRFNYYKNYYNIGGNMNLLRSYAHGSAPWKWVIGDDDFIPPTFSATSFEELLNSDIGVIILCSSVDSPVIVDSHEWLFKTLTKPSLFNESTLVSARLIKSKYIDFIHGFNTLNSLFCHSYSFTSYLLKSSSRIGLYPRSNSIELQNAANRPRIDFSYNDKTELSYMNSNFQNMVFLHWFTHAYAIKALGGQTSDWYRSYYIQHIAESFNANPVWLDNQLEADQLSRFSPKHFH